MTGNGTMEISPPNNVNYSPSLGRPSGCLVALKGFPGTLQFLENVLSLKNRTVFRHEMCCVALSCAGVCSVMLSLCVFVRAFAYVRVCAGVCRCEWCSWGIVGI